MLLAYRRAFSSKLGWYKRCSKYVPPEYRGDKVPFSDRKEVARIWVMKSSWPGPFAVYISGYKQVEDGTGPIPHLGTSAEMLGGRWTQTKCLTVRRAEWRAWDMPPDFDNLSTFPVIESLFLDDVIFPSIAIFGRLVCALPALAPQPHVHPG